MDFKKLVWLRTKIIFLFNLIMFYFYRFGYDTDIKQIVLVVDREVKLYILYKCKNRYTCISIVNVKY
jgi:hypothetical protein